MSRFAASLKRRSQTAVEIFRRSLSPLQPRQSRGNSKLRTTDREASASALLFLVLFEDLHCPLTLLFVINTGQGIVIGDGSAILRWVE